ncbi:PEX19 family protein [Megaselia abdita]
MSSDDKKDAAVKSDQALNDLLDDALADLQKVEKKSETPSAEGVEEANGDSEITDEDFFIEQAKLLSERMNKVFGGTADAPAAESQPLSEEQFALGFQKMAEAAAMALQGQTSITDEGQKFSSSISEALKGLQQGVDNIQAPISEDDVANMFSNLNMGEAGAGEEGNNPFLPFMEGMMQSLLSAEILLPSIKELLDKYPSYLAENADTIPAEDKERFEKQHELFKVIKADLESEKPDDTAEVKSKRFKTVLENMQKLHEYGQPPVELVGEQGAPFDNPAALGGGNPQCPMM